MFLTYASAQGRAFLDRALYLPQAWAADDARRTEAGVPVAITFQTKPALAQAMLARALAAGVPFAWVTGDEVYGGDRRLRLWLEAQHLAHLLAIKATEPLWVATARGPAQVPAADLIAALPAAAWVTLSAGDGAKGPRRSDWAWLPIRPLREPGKGYWLLARLRAERRHRPGVLRRLWPGGDLAARTGAGGRHALDDRDVLRGGEGRGRTGPVRGAALGRLAPARHPEPAGARGPGGHPRGDGQKGGADDPLTAVLLPLTVPEVRRLLRIACQARNEAERGFRLAWSQWRRRHQARARRSHYLRRQAAHAARPPPSNSTR